MAFWVDAGTGFHIGILNVFHVPFIASSLDLSLRLEYRYFTGDYIPAYFNSFYEIQKFSYPYKNESTGREDTIPKRQVLQLLGDHGLNGYYAELILNFFGYFTIGASYDDYDGPYNSNLRIFIDFSALSFIQLGCYYYRHNYEGADQALAFDDKSLFLGEARVQITSFLYLVGQYWRIWQLVQNSESGQYEYEPVNDWSVGLGISYTF